MGRPLSWVVVLVVLAATFIVGRDYVRRHPQDFPWTSLDLRHPVGVFTAGKIAALGVDPALCRVLLVDAGVADVEAPPQRSPPDCGYEDGVRLSARSPAYSPAGLITSCPVAAALHLFETRVVQPAAERHFGQRVERIRHSGSYSCRRIYGREDGRFSEHSTADAIDITAFALEGGKQISVLGDWGNGGPEAKFLNEVRDGACRLFSTVLSPDYNEAHRDHLHLDVARRGTMTWTLCQ